MGEFHCFRVCFEGLKYALVSTSGYVRAYFLLTKLYTERVKVKVFYIYRWLMRAHKRFPGWDAGTPLVSGYLWFGCLEEYIS